MDCGPDADLMQADTVCRVVCAQSGALDASSTTTTRTRIRMWGGCCIRDRMVWERYQCGVMQKSKPDSFRACHSLTAGVWLRPPETPNPECFCYCVCVSWGVAGPVPV